MVLNFVLLFCAFFISYTDICFLFYNVDCKKKRKRTTSLGVSKKRRKLLPFSPSEDTSTRYKQMQSLAVALTATGADYSNELTYIPGMAPRSANCSTLEREGMQVHLTL